MGGIEIAYQNKDITSKVLAENFKGKTFRVYGLGLPEVKRVLPTNIPAVKVNELRLDNLFELADGSAAIVDYESGYRKEDKAKYLNYLAGIASRYLKEKGSCPQLRMVVIYTGDIKRAQVSGKFDIGALKMEVDCAFLSELDSVGIFRRLEQKVQRGEKLDDDELMEFIILPLSYRKKEEKQEGIRKTVDLAAQIRDKGQQLFTLAGILAFTDKLIDRETASKIRRMIEMTQVAQIFEEEKQQALKQAAQLYEKEKRQAAQLYEEEKRQAAQLYEEEKRQTAQLYEEEKRQAAKLYEEEKRQAAKTANRKVVIRMIQKDYPTEEIASLVSSYSQDDIDALRKELAEKN